jgi:Pyridoxamine 5'-phosphate oxidase
VRPLSEEEVASLLARDVVARVATVDADGYPHVTPLWFLWNLVARLRGRQRVLIRIAPSRVIAVASV